MSVRATRNRRPVEQRPSNSTARSTGWIRRTRNRPYWLARLYRLKNDHDKAEEVLKAILKTDPENEPAVEQLTQLLMDEGKGTEAVTLLEGITAHSPSPVLAGPLGRCADPGS